MKDIKGAVEKDRPFEPWRSPRTAKVSAIVAQAVAELEAFEAVHGLRKRRRRPGDHTVFLDAVAALVCDALHRELEKLSGRVAVSLSKSTLARGDRYGSPVLSEQLPDILSRLAHPDLRWLTFQKGHQGFAGAPGRMSTFGAGERLLALLRASQVHFEDLGRRPGEEVVILKSSREGHWARSTRLPYPDTADTRTMRAEVQAINAWLEKAELGLDDWSSSADKIDVGDRRLRRVFNNGRWDHGGRLFGGFWQGMRSNDRTSIVFGEDREPAVELDYGQTSLRILYGLAGREPPPGDLYSVPGLEGLRSGVKKLFVSLMFDEGDRTRFPRGTAHLFPARRSIKAPEVIERVLEYHSGIREVLEEPGAGYRAWAVESRIMVKVLLTLLDRQVVTLPIHDGVVVPQGDARVAEGVLRKTFRSETGVEGIVLGGLGTSDGGGPPPITPAYIPIGIHPYP